jgi:serine/threonine protein phosphatase PrpC
MPFIGHVLLFLGNLGQARKEELMTVECLVVEAPLVEGGPSEDACAIELGGEDGSFFVAVADGHGVQVNTKGHRIKPSQAVVSFSRQVVDSLRRQFRLTSEPTLFPVHFDAVAAEVDSWRSHVNRRARPGQQAVGAVASVLTIKDGAIHLAQAGDCRLYGSVDDQFGFRRLSKDHTWASSAEEARLQPWIDSGAISIHLSERTVVHGDRGLMPRSYVCITDPDTKEEDHIEPSRSFGDWEFGEAVPHTPECRRFDLELYGEHELYALCSDGGNWIVEEVLGGLKGRAMTAPLEEIRLMTEALCGDPMDDITIVWFRKVP